MFCYNYDVAEMRIAYNIRLSQVILAADPTVHIVSWQDFDDKFYGMLRYHKFDTESDTKSVILDL